MSKKDVSDDEVQALFDEAEEVPMITHREHYIEDGVQKERLHVMPVSEWAAYEKEHGL